MSSTASGSWPAQAATVPAARRLVRRALSAASEAGGLCEDAELLVSELVANVVLHVGGTVDVVVSLTPGEVLLEVSDESPVEPTMRLFSRTSSTGRGMRLVTSLSVAHGVRTRTGGKTVWVRLSTATAGRSDDDLMASFAEVDWLADLEADGASGAAPAEVRAWGRPAA